MVHARPDESQAGVKTARRNINHRCADDTTLIGDSKGGKKEPVDDGQRGE